MNKGKNKVLLFYGKQSNDQPNDWIPYNILYLTAPLVEAGFEVVFIAEFENPDYEGIIRKHAADSIIFGVSAFTSGQITSGIEACRIFRKYSADTPIAWGGHHVIALPEQTLGYELIDIVFTGPSEDSFLQVVSAIRGGRGDLQKIPGIILKVSGEIVSTGKPDSFDLAKLPSFPFHILNIEKYINPKTKTLNYTASCGCPGNCSFCPWWGSHMWRPLPVERVLDDIEWLVNTYKPRNILFTDPNFFARKDFVIDFVNGLIKRKIEVFWYAFTRVNDFVKITREEIERFEGAGLVELFFGIEQTTDRMKKLLRKPFKMEHVDTVLEKTKGLTLSLRFSFLLGLPTETIEDIDDIQRHIIKWQAINKNFVPQGNQYVPYPGNPMYELAVKLGLVVPDSLEGWGDFAIPKYRDAAGNMNLWHDVPWFSDDLNREYAGRFLDIFPQQEGFNFKETA